MVPYYSEYWEKRRRQGDRASWETIENWPVLEKEQLRIAPEAFVAEDCDIRKMFHEHTSGTTGKPLDLWWSRDTVRNWYALFEARCRRWYGISRHDRWAIFGGQVISPITQRRPPFWVWNQALNQLYISSYHISPDTIPAYLDALVRYQVRYLLGYTSSIYTLAKEIQLRGLLAPKMKVVITNAEPIYDHQRTVLEEVFQCPVKETYGMAEIVTAVSECEANNLHIWPEVGIIEDYPEIQLPNEELTKDLICTGLLNADMPLIRYRVGDRAVLSSSKQICSCGRELPMLASIEGRKDDILYTVDGRIVGRLDPVFKTRLPIHEAQIVQDSLDYVRIRFIPAPGYSPEAGYSMIERLKDRMGEINVTLEPVDKIPREPNGKFRAVVCNLPEEVLDSLRK
jgi:phenylacetate-CoA ligase